MIFRYLFRDNTMLGSLGFFILLVTVFYGFYYYLLNSSYLNYYFTALAASVYWVFSLFDPHVAFEGTTIYYADMPSLIIIKGCDGLAVVFLVVSAVLSFPRHLKSKVAGALILTLFLLIINWLRIVVLASVKFYAPFYFDIFHLYFFQTVMIAAACLSFLCWIMYSEKLHSGP